MIAGLLLACLGAAPDTAAPSVRHFEWTIQTRDLTGLRRGLDSVLSASGARKLSSSGNGRGASYGNAVELRIELPDARVDAVKSLLEARGEIVRESSSLRLVSDEIDSLERERTWLLERSKTWKAEVARRQLSESESAESLWETQQRQEQEIFQLDKELASARKSARGSRLELTLRQSSETPTESGHGFFEFVNMPGVEYTALWVENPAPGRTAPRYQGFLARYMFTRGKSWIELGALEAQGGQKTDTLYNDLFLYAWGTDFYPRHFGRGLRRWFNVYSGFSLGGAFLSSTSGNTHILFVSPHAGVELFKSDRVMLDVRGSYFVPLSSRLHLKLRGLGATTGLQLAF
ncbi:MAG: hypothetical protein RL318_2030 [Fibrobacterota bacterium]|jgi:hypothetical protein